MGHRTMSRRTMSRRTMRHRGSLSIVLACLAMGGCAKPTVVRAARGVTYEGRFIPARAYEAYARGSLAEAEGRFADAVRSYRVAAELDDEGPEPWTRLGAALCKQGHRAEAEDAFDEAVEADATFGAAHREMARCALAAGDTETALEASVLATILDPDDDAAVLVYVDALEQSGRHATAAQTLVARLVGDRASRLLAERLAQLALKLDDRALARMAEEALARSGAAATSVVSAKSPEQRTFLPPVHPNRNDVDAALIAGDLGLARKIATRAKTSQGEIALRAAALGKLETARAQGTLVADADPLDASAAIALLFASSRLDLGAAAARTREMRLDTAPTLARLLFAEALLREVGPDGARALLGPSDLEAERRDPLEEASRKRLIGALRTSPQSKENETRPTQ